MRIRGHKLIDLRHNGEMSRAESMWTFECECGASEAPTDEGEKKAQENS